MNTELSPGITRTCSNTNGKIASFNNFRLCRKLQHDAMFRAIKQHVTGTYNVKQRHGMNLLIA